MREISYIILHHTGTPAVANPNDLDGSEIVRAIKRQHHENATKEITYPAFVAKWGEYVCDYHYFVGPTGAVFSGMPEDRPAWNCGVPAINQTSLAVCFLGDFEKSVPPLVQINTGINLVKNLMKKYNVPIEKVKRHKDLVATDCPGKFFPYEKFITALQEPSELDKDVGEAIHLGLLRPAPGIDMKKYNEEYVTVQRLATFLVRLYHLTKGG